MDSFKDFPKNGRGVEGIVIKNYGIAGFPDVPPSPGCSMQVVRWLVPEPAINWHQGGFIMQSGIVEQP